MDRSGGVGRDELEVDVDARQVGRAAVAGAGGQHLFDDHALGRGLDAQVDEPGAGDLGGGDAIGLGQRSGQPSGQVAGVDADLLGQLQRHVGGVVAVFGVAGPLDGDDRGQGGRVESVLGQHRGSGGLEQLGQIGGGHGGPSYGLGWSAPESVSRVRSVRRGVIGPSAMR